MQIRAMQFYSTITDSGEQESCTGSIDFNFERFAKPDSAMTGTDLIDHPDLVHIQVVRLGLVHILREHSNEVAAGFGTHDFFSHLAFAVSAYCSSSSMPIHFLWRCSQAIKVLPDPRNGS